MCRILPIQKVLFGLLERLLLVKAVNQLRSNLTMSVRLDANYYTLKQAGLSTSVANRSKKMAEILKDDIESLERVKLKRAKQDFELYGRSNYPELFA